MACPLLESAALRDWDQDVDGQSSSSALSEVEDEEISDDGTESVSSLRCEYEMPDMYVRDIQLVRDGGIELTTDAAVFVMSPKAARRRKLCRVPVTQRSRSTEAMSSSQSQRSDGSDSSEASAADPKARMASSSTPPTDIERRLLCTGISKRTSEQMMPMYVRQFMQKQRLRRPGAGVDARCQANALGRNFTLMDGSTRQVLEDYMTLKPPSQRRHSIAGFYVA